MSGYLHRSVDTPTTGAIVAAIGWVARSYISSRINKDLESHKASLQLEGSREITQLAARLAEAAEQAQTRYTILHSKRAEIVAEAYSLLDQVLKAAGSFLQPIEFGPSVSKSTKFKELATVANQLKKYFDAHRIFFGPDTCEKFDALFLTVQMHSSKFFVALSFADDFPDDHDVAKSKMDAWLAGAAAMEKEVPELKSALEVEFRAILGVGG